MIYKIGLIVVSIFILVKVVAIIYVNNRIENVIISFKNNGWYYQSLTKKEKWVLFVYVVVAFGIMKYIKLIEREKDK